MRHLLVTLALAVCLQGCSQTPTAPNTPSATPVSSGISASQIAELKSKCSDGKHFGFKERGEMTNGPVFLALAASDEKMAAAALEGMAETYTNYAPDKKKNQVDAAYAETVSRYLESSDPLTLYAALKASQNLMGKTPHGGIVKKLNEIGRNHKQLGARVLALDTLCLVDSFLKDPEILATFVGALKDEPAAQSTALFRINHGSGYVADKSAVLAAVQTLISSKDPGVRGRALEDCGVLSSAAEKQQLVASLETALKDPHPFVRSMAVSALAAVQGDKALGQIMPLLSDQGKCTYDLSYPALNGQAGSVHHDGSPWSRVDDAALYAIARASSALGDKKFVYGKIDHRAVDRDIAREVKHARTWYAALH